MVRLCRGEGQTRADVFLLQIRKIAQHFGPVYTGGNKIEDILHPIRMPRMQGRPPHSFGLKVMRSMTWSLTLTAEGSKGSKRFPSPPLWFAYRLPAQITLDPYPLYLAAVFRKLGTTRWRCDKPAGRAAVVGSLLIVLLATPEFNLPTVE